MVEMSNLLVCFLRQCEKLARDPLPFLFGGHARAHVPMDASVHILTCQPTLQNVGLNLDVRLCNGGLQGEAWIWQEWTASQTGP